MAEGQGQSKGKIPGGRAAAAAVDDGQETAKEKEVQEEEAGSAWDCDEHDDAWLVDDAGGVSTGAVYFAPSDSDESEREDDDDDQDISSEARDFVGVLEQPPHRSGEVAGQKRPLDPWSTSSADPWIREPRKDGIDMSINEFASKFRAVGSVPKHAVARSGLVGQPAGPSHLTCAA